MENWRDVKCGAGDGILEIGDRMRMDADSREEGIWWED